MAVQLVSADSLARSNGVKIVVYGRSGLGKTMLACTMPNPIVLSAESGMLSLKRDNIERIWGPNNPTITYDIPVIQINTVEDLVAAETYLRTDPQGMQFNPILDSATEIAEQVLANAKKQVKDPRQAYGELIEQMTKTIKAFRDLPGRHVLLNFKEERSKDEGTGLTLAGPSMPGQKMGPATPYLTDEVFQLFIGQNPDGSKYRAFRTQPDFNADAKDRSGCLDEVEMPHIGHIINKIMGNGPQPQQ
ncbi:putative AAA family ATPase [Vibrio phage pVco-14]|nr:putative AAA family ATPase [Vibrio phage pVco-14]